jgi:hypothetical protein
MSPKKTEEEVNTPTPDAPATETPDGEAKAPETPATENIDTSTDPGPATKAEAPAVEEVVEVKSDAEVSAEKAVTNLKAVAESLHESFNTIQAVDPKEFEGSAGRVAAAGTKLRMGDREVTLAHDTVLKFSGDESEQVFVGMCVISGNIEANARVFEGKYDGLGNKIEVVAEAEAAPEPAE